MIRFSGAAGGRSGPALNAEASAIQVVVVLVIKDIELDAVGRQFEPCMLVAHVWCDLGCYPKQ